MSETDYTKCCWCGESLADEKDVFTYYGYDIAGVRFELDGTMLGSPDDTKLHGYLCEHCANIAAHANEILEVLNQNVEWVYTGDGPTKPVAEALFIKRFDPNWKAPWEKED